MQKIIKIALIAIGVLSAVLWYLLPSADMPAAEAAQSGAMNTMFIITYLLLGIAVVVSLVFTLKNLFFSFPRKPRLSIMFSLESKK